MKYKEERLEDVKTSKKRQRIDRAQRKKLLEHLRQLSPNLYNLEEEEFFV